MNEKFQKLGFYPADILLPKDADMTKWAVVACDQFTSQPEYWQAVEETVGDAPSTLRLILPEAKLNDPDVDAHIADINGAMNRYLAEGVFQTLPGSLFYIERTQSDGKVRHGLIGMVDLDQYDFTPGSGALIRATEGTVLSRIPPRVRVRQDAPVELPHVMLLIDDPDRTVIEPLTAASGEMEQLYDFDLQQGGVFVNGCHGDQVGHVVLIHRRGHADPADGQLGRALELRNQAPDLYHLSKILRGGTYRPAVIPDLAVHGAGPVPQKGAEEGLSRGGGFQKGAF